MVLIVEVDPRCPAGLFAELLSAWKTPHAYWRPHAGEPAASLNAVRGVIILGGAMGVQDVREFPFLLAVKGLLREILAADTPCFGVCLGGQLLAEALGAPVHSRRYGEHGCNTITLTPAGSTDPLFSGLSSPFPTFHWHNDSFEIPAGAVHLAFTSVCPSQALRYGRAWGVQFHPEVTAAIVDDWRHRIHADEAVVVSFQRRQAQLQAVGERLLRNFVQIADCPPSIP